MNGKLTFVMVFLAVMVAAVCTDVVVACATCGCRGAKAGTVKVCPVTGATARVMDPACPTGACAASAPEPATPAKPADHDHGSDVRLDPAVPTVSTAGLKALLDARVPLTLVDARSAKYDDGFRLPGAKYLPAGSSAADVRRALVLKNKLVVTYCANLQCPASAALAKQLHEMGYTSVIEYPYGIQGWREAGLAVEKAR